jgi:hypothetical protein
MDNNPQSNVSEKYAVYTVGSDGKSILSVVVDSHDEAKKELEKLKSGTACVKINKSKVENFGKDGEKIIESTEVECWKKEDNASSSVEKLSSFQKAQEMAAPVIADGSGDNLNAGGNTIIPAAIETAKKSFKEKLEVFYGYFSNHGDLMGIGYGFFPSTVKAVESNGVGSPSGNIGTDGKPEIIVDEKEEIKKLAAEVAELKEKISELISLEKEENEESGDSDDEGKD